MSALLGHKKHLDKLLALAKKGAISHAYLFTGPAGLGKKATALRFAENLEHGKKENHHALSDLVLLERGAEEQTIGIDQVRAFHEKLLERPQQSLYRVGILDEAERMTPEAQNALLKLAEEPPSQAILVVITSQPEALFETVRSRLQPVVFSPVDEKEIVAWLVETHELPKKEAEKYARQSGGCPGLAIRLANDEQFRALQEAAQALLAEQGSRDRTALIKQLIEEETPLTDILDALIREIAYTVRDDTSRFAFWHDLLTLRKQAERGSLNTRLQLEALFAR